MTNHMNQLEAIACRDVQTLREKERTYGGSWKKRGGVGAFMMLARKMDRLEVISAAAGYDIFGVIEKQGLGGADGELLAEIRDLRCYLLLVEAEMTARLRADPEEPQSRGYVNQDEPPQIYVSNLKWAIESGPEYIETKES